MTSFKGDRIRLWQTAVARIDLRMKAVSLTGFTLLRNVSNEGTSTEVTDYNRNVLCASYEHSNES
jgi:hypothetical protein